MIQVRARGPQIELYERIPDAAGGPADIKVVAQLTLDETELLIARIAEELPDAKKAAWVANAQALQQAKQAVADAQARLLEAQRRQQQLEAGQ